MTHFEIYAEDPEALAEFYRGLFGWRIDKAPGVDYYMVRTGGNGLDGGLQHRPIPEPRSWVHYVSVDSLDAALERVEQLGGSIIRARTAVPKAAWYAVVSDPDGNVFALWEADPNAFPTIEPE